MRFLEGTRFASCTCTSGHKSPPKTHHGRREGPSIGRGKNTFMTSQFVVGLRLQYSGTTGSNTANHAKWPHQMAAALESDIPPFLFFLSFYFILENRPIFWQTERLHTDIIRSRIIKQGRHCALEQKYWGCCIRQRGCTGCRAREQSVHDDPLAPHRHL